MRGATLLRRRDHPEYTFQSTLLMRGATVGSMMFINSIYNFNPRSSCEERPAVITGPLVCKIISIHAPHARSDSRPFFEMRGKDYFNPRSSCEERRRSASSSRSCQNFNPRSSCEERRDGDAGHCLRRYFNPRSSCEERPPTFQQGFGMELFQSTLLMRGATIRF